MGRRPKSARKPAANLSMGTTSPPETPMASPVARRRKARGRKNARSRSKPDQARHSILRRPHSPTAPPRPAAPSPIGAGVSVPPHLNRYAQISPQSSPSDLSDPEYLESDSMEAPSSEDSSSEDSDPDPDPDSDSDSPAMPRRCGPAHPVPRVVSTDRSGLRVEELTDLDPMDSDRDDVLRPVGYEYPDSEQSRPTTRNGPAGSGPPGLEREFVENMQNLTCSNESDDEFDPDEAELREFVQWQKELKRRHRISHGSSIGKRTISERGDSDHEDLKPFPNGESPTTDRRMRRRVDRRSSFFQDHTPERIPELDEPDSEESGDSDDNLARELPYFDLEIMEVDDSD